MLDYSNLKKILIKALPVYITKIDNAELITVKETQQKNSSKQKSQVKKYKTDQKFKRIMKKEGL